MSNDESANNIELSQENFNATISYLASKPGSKYEFIMKAGNSLRPALFNLCKIVWETGKIPNSWSKSRLIQLYKGTGPRNILSNHRFIHTRSDFSKFFGHLVMNEAKNKIIGNMSKFQIGTKPGHRSSEHIFVIKSVISLYLKYDKPIILTAFDISKFFDSECLVDVMNELFKNEIHGKIYRLLYSMNKSCKIQVHTPVGVSETADTGETLAQGSIEAAIASAVSLDNGGVRDFFDNSEHKVHYQDLPLAPLLYQDDIARLSLSVQSAQFGNDALRSVAESKLLNFNVDKSGFVIFGSKQRRLEILNELDVKPLELCGMKMKQISSVKYLGDFLSERGLSDSVHVTVSKRKGLVTRAIYDIKSVINDCRAHVTGKLKSGIDLWESSVIPMLLYNAETWQDINKTTLEQLEKLQVIFLRSLFSVGSGCPLPLLYSQTGKITNGM